jgi:hypothetical protein
MEGAEATRRAGEIARAAAEYAAAEPAGGPDIAAVFDAHMAAEFEQKDVDATMATMVDEPYLNHVAVMTGGRGRAEVLRFYRDHFIPRWPADTRVSPVSRTVGRAQVVDELVLGFTHDVEMDFLLPGVPPPGGPWSSRPSWWSGSRRAGSRTSTSTGTRPAPSSRRGCWTPPGCR